MKSEHLPSISIIIPTLNSQKFLSLCLRSIRSQHYPREKIEIIVIDGGSTDTTLSIAKNFNAGIYKNPQKTAETGKAIGIKKATGELIALIDSDNVLPDSDWLIKMTFPFKDLEIIGSEPWAFTYDQKMGYIDRYCALLGVNDPVCYFMGNYDRMCRLSGSWTGLDIKSDDKGNYLKLYLTSPLVPTIGANGTIYRSSVIKEYLRKDVINNYFVDVDFINKLTVNQIVIFAKVKVSITHYYCGNNLRKFIRKQNRRISDFLYHQKRGERSNSWQQAGKAGIIKFIISCLLVFPLLYQTTAGLLKKSDPVWLFHPVACYVTLFIYGIGEIKSIIGLNTPNRLNWKQ